MADGLKDRLAACAATGEVVWIIYHGGSQPGTIREVKPLHVAADEMQALDVGTGVAKTFVLSKVELAAGTAAAPSYDPNAASLARDSQTIREALSPKVADLEAIGWVVQF